MKPSALLFFSIALLGAAACNLTDEDQCSDGERGCDGNVARVCEYFKDASCDKEGGCYPNGSRWAWRYADCRDSGGMCVADGICTKETKPDPRCGTAKHVCDGLKSIECASGFAIGESDGHLELRSDAGVLRVGDTMPIRIARVSDCGQVDVTSETPLESSAPNVLRIDVDRVLVARAPGKASVTTGGVVLATFEVRRACSDIQASDTPESIFLGPDWNSLAPGETQKLVARVYWPYPDECPRKLEDADGARWSSSEDAIARVDADGIVTAVAQGKAMVTAEWRDVTSHFAAIYVTAP